MVPVISFKFSLGCKFLFSSFLTIFFSGSKDKKYVLRHTTGMCIVILGQNIYLVPTNVEVCPTKQYSTKYSKAEVQKKI